MRTASWVIKNKETGEAMFETYSSWILLCLNTDKYEAVPIHKHLASLSERSLAVNTNKH